MADETNLPISKAQRIKFDFHREDLPEGEDFDRTFLAMRNLVEQMTQLKNTVVGVDLKHPQGSRETPSDPEDESHTIWQDTSTGALKSKVTSGGSTTTREFADLDSTQVFSNKSFSDSVDIGGDLEVTGASDMLGTLTSTGIFTPTGGIKIVNQSEAYRVKRLDTGVWNMDTVSVVNIAHGLTSAAIMNVSCFVKHDTNGFLYNLLVNGSGGVGFSNSVVQVTRLTGGGFDNTGFNSTSFNRGIILIFYKV